MTLNDRLHALMAAHPALDATECLRLATGEWLAAHALHGPPARRWGDEAEYIARHEAKESAE